MDIPKKKIRVYMGITTTGTVLDAQQYFLRDIADTYSDYFELVFPKLCTRRIFHDFARNKVTELFLESDCDVLWFLDSDVAPATHIGDLIALYWDDWKIAGAPYPVFMHPPGSDQLEVVYTCYNRPNLNENRLVLAKVPRSGTAFVDGLATGCLFIKREVFEKLEKPYFEFKFAHDDRDLTEGEDLGFCLKVSDLGYKFFVNYSILCRHQKTVDLLDVNNYAISYANRAIAEYQEQLKPQLEVTYRQAYDAGIAKGRQVEPKKSSIWLPPR